MDIYGAVNLLQNRMFGNLQEYKTQQRILTLTNVGRERNELNEEMHESAVHKATQIWFMVPSFKHPFGFWHLKEEILHPKKFCYIRRHSLVPHPGSGQQYFTSLTKVSQPPPRKTSSNHPNYDAYQLAQLLENELARIQAGTNAIRSRAQNGISTAQRAQDEKSARQDRRLNAEIVRLDTESQRSMQRADNENNARIQIQRDEMKRRQDREDRMADARIQIEGNEAGRRQDREDLMAKARLGFDDDGKDPGENQ
jgi:hypothetical protein